MRVNPTHCIFYQIIIILLFSAGASADDQTAARVGFECAALANLSPLDSAERVHIARLFLFGQEAAQRLTSQIDILRQLEETAEPDQIIKNIPGARYLGRWDDELVRVYETIRLPGFLIGVIFGKVTSETEEYVILRSSREKIDVSAVAKTMFWERNCSVIGK